MQPGASRLIRDIPKPRDEERSSLVEIHTIAHQAIAVSSWVSVGFFDRSFADWQFLMKSRISKGVIFFLTLLLGGALGFGYSWWGYSETMRSVADTGQDAFASALFIYELDEAERQSSNPSREVALYAISRAVSNLQKFQPPRQVLLCRSVPFRIAKLNIRLAHLYQETGNISERNAQLQLALLQFAKMGWTLESVTELEKALPLIEAGKTVQAVKTFGKAIAPPCQ